MPRLSMTAIARCAAMAAMMLLGVGGRRLGSSTGSSLPRASATDGMQEDAAGQWGREATMSLDVGWLRAHAGLRFLAGVSDAAKATDNVATAGRREEEKTASATGVDAKNMAVKVRHKRREVDAKSIVLGSIPCRTESIMLLCGNTISAATTTSHGGDTLSVQ
jgi:hypothetical protein